MAVDSRGFFEQMNYYNENNPEAAEWLRELIKGGHVAPGIVDERSIVDVQPNDVQEFVQCHFFAGIAGWPYALRLAGWPDDQPVGTGSCPCQPFSDAGKHLGEQDPRHLWPAWFRLIKTCNEQKQKWASVLFGEQVASKAGREWLAGIFADLEAVGYSRAGADLCSPGVGSPNLRQRLWWFAILMDDANQHGGAAGVSESITGQARIARILEHAGNEEFGTGGGCIHPAVWLVHAKQPGLEGFTRHEHDGNQSGWVIAESDRSASAAGPINFWSRCAILECKDGFCRRAEPESFPLVDGVPGRVGLLRGYGNAINPHLAAEFVKAAVEAIENTQ